MASEATVNVSDFTRRFKAFQGQWQVSPMARYVLWICLNPGVWQSADHEGAQSPGGWGEVAGVSGIAIVSGTSDTEQLRYLKSGALQLWLFGYEFPGTLLSCSSGRVSPA